MTYLFQTINCQNQQHRLVTYSEFWGRDVLTDKEHNYFENGMPCRELTRWSPGQEFVDEDINSDLLNEFIRIWQLVYEKIIWSY